MLMGENGGQLWKKYPGPSKKIYMQSVFEIISQIGAIRIALKRNCYYLEPD